MQRYFVDPLLIRAGQVRIIGDDVHHIRHVMRNHVGDHLRCSDGQGMDYVIEIEKMGSQEILCRVIHSNQSISETKTQVTLAQSLPRKDKWEWILQKATEVGVTSFVPFLSERTVVKMEGDRPEKKYLRWQKIAKEAAEQSHRGIIPEIQPVCTWDQLISMIRTSPQSLIAYEKGGVPISTLDLSEEILLITGPEGGFTEEEMEEARDAGATPITLGPRILRAETAPLVALSCILFQRGEMG